MIQRRQFIGSLAAACAAPTIPSRLFGQVDTPQTPWRCDVIQTQSLNRGERAPVVTGISIQPEGEHLAIVGDDHYVCVYDLRSQAFHRFLDDHTDWVRTTQFSPDGARLATAGNDRKVRIWKCQDYSLRPDVFPHPQAVIEVCFSSDSARLATVGFSEQLRLFDLQQRRLINQLRCECPDNHAVAFSPDDSLIAAGGRSGVIRIWETDSGRLIEQIPVHRQRVRAIEFATNHRLISCGDDQMIHVSDLERADGTKPLPRQAAKLFAVKLLDQDRLATSGSDNMIHIWQLSTGKEIDRLKGHTGTVSCLDYAAQKLVSGSYDTQVRIWHQDNQAPLDRQTHLEDGWNRRPLN